MNMELVLFIISFKFFPIGNVVIFFSLCHFDLRY